jgi:hypothetical protein
MKSIRIPVCWKWICLLCVLVTLGAARLDAQVCWRSVGGVTTTLQMTSDSRIDPELLGSGDLVLERLFPRGSFRIYIEANTTPAGNGVSSVIPEANTDAGSALDENREGRLQISELAYEHTLGERSQFTIGMLDVTGYFDQSRISSDENTQFLGVSFVQNPTIEFPDYTLGVVVEKSLSKALMLRAAVTSSNGISDNPNVSYAQLLDVANRDKGVFAIASATCKHPKWHVRSGCWTNTASHFNLAGTREDLPNYGLYMLGGVTLPRGGLNIRLGTTNDNVSRVARYAALSYQYVQNRITIGLGVGRMFLSERERSPDQESSIQYESYLRWDISDNILATIDLQHMINPNFDHTGLRTDPEITIIGVRLTYFFE